MTVIKFFVISTLLLFNRQCSKNGVEVSDVPECVQAKIAEISQADVWNPPASVYSYSFNGQKVYYITARCCDIPSQLYNADCKLICRPDGGYTGKGDNACPDFFDAREDEKLVWKDQRAP